MIYLNDENIRQVGVNWKESIDVIEYAVGCLADDDYAQPIKPYLRYRDLKNRIIAMPAFVGGKINMSGIKWIASFPDNINNGLPRAHSVVILNDAATGMPLGVLNAISVSAIRTASVSGLVLRKYLQNKQLPTIKVGIVGMGPIGQHHLHMCASLLQDMDASFVLYDIRGVDLSAYDEALREKIIVADHWKDAYWEMDVFITCTVSRDRYIDEKPKPGSLHLNVSLRDYTTRCFNWFAEGIIVDDWEEVCRENTDIEKFHLDMGLQKADVKSIQDVVLNNCLAGYNQEQPVLFNPMGMAVFDISIAQYYMQQAANRAIGVVLD